MTGGKPPTDTEGLLTTAQRGRRVHTSGPQRIGERYEVLEQLGRGGMATVQRVRDLGSGSVLALKQLTISRQSSRASEITALFQREFHTLAQLSHPSVIEVYDYGVDAGGPYYTMELLDGGDLTQHVPLHYVRACELVLQVCSSLSLLHSRRWVHRDVTPRNVHCTDSGHAKLIDFGAMVPFGERVSSIGTPAFTAPEVLRELPLDGRTDLFSLGATLYYVLTGQPPFAARSFTELREAWSTDPAPPSVVAPDIPEALDALVLSLLRIDPASRPRSPFEVMQRLAAIAGVSEPEPLHVSQAYLSTPTLVGRDAALQLCREHVSEALQGRGGGLLFEGAPGVGRSRLLDACVLEAKTLGATVLRLAGRATGSAPFSGLRALSAELLRALPHAAAERAAGLEALAPWITTLEQRVTLRPSLAKSGLPQAMLTWLERVSQSHALVIAVDDSELLDDASLGVLASLAQVAPELRVLVLATTQSDLPPSAAPALALLSADCTSFRLAALTSEETEQLFTSVFGGAAHVPLLSDRVHKIAAGNPRETMALAQYVLDVGIVRYADGVWSLPAALSLSELPHDPDDRLRARLAGLPALARRLLEAQALSLSAAFERGHYSELAPGVPARHVREAVDSLLREGFLTSEGSAFVLSQRSLAGWLSSQLSAAERLQHHAALARAWQRGGGSGLHDVYHLLLAEEPGAALERLNQALRANPVPNELQRHAGMGVSELALVLTRAHEAARAHGSPRTVHEIARQLTALSLLTDNKLHARYAPAWLAQLERDSGLCDYRALPEQPGSSRLQRALELVMARHAEQPVAERVYSLQEAIPNLAWYVTLSIAIGSRTRNVQLLSSLGALLEPFASLDPLLDALWQNALSAYEMNFAGQSARAHARARDVFERLSAPRTDEHGAHLDTIRKAIAFSVGLIEVSRGLETADHWIEMLDSDPLQRVNAMYLRRLLCIYRGDAEGAEHYRRQAELLSLQASARQMFAMPLRRELMAQLQLGDLAAVKRVADQIAELSAAEPGWKAQHNMAQGMYQRLRGDYEAARDAFEEAIQAAEALGDRSTWVDAMSGLTGVLVELHRPAEARALGLAALARCSELAIDWEATDLRRELALAEAKCGDFAGAIARIEALLAERAQLMQTHRAHDHEARARIALWAGEPQAPELIAEVATLQLSLGRGAAFLRRYPRLVEDAKRAGLQLALSPTAFETSVLHTAAVSVLRPEIASARAELAAIPDLASREQRALTLLVEATHAQSGRLYLARNGELVQVASLNVADASGLDEAVCSQWLQAGTTTELSTVATAARTSVSQPVAWSDARGTAYRLLFLPPAPNTAACPGVCALGDSRRWLTPAERQLAQEISAALTQAKPA